MRKSIGIVLALFLFAGVALIRGSAQPLVADLNVSGSGSADATYGWYNATVVNNGPDTANQVMVGASTGLTSFVYVNISQGTCTINGNSFSCNVGTLAPGASVSVSVQGRLPYFGYHHPTINFCGFGFGASDPSDSNTSDNSVTICVSVPAQ
jgi:hypothetical protein